MESTIIENEMLDELADFVGLRPQVSEITRRAMNGETRFRRRARGARRAARGSAGSRARRGGQPHPADAGRAAAGRDDAQPPARCTALVSGGFTVFAERVARRTRFRSRRRQPARSDRQAASPAPCAADRDRRDQARDAARAGRRTRHSAEADDGRRRRRQRSADARLPPGSAWPSTPSRRSPPPRAGASITPI